MFLYRTLLFCLKEVPCGISPVCLSVLVTYDYNYNPSKIYEKIPLVHPKTLTRRKRKKKQEVGGNLSLCMHFIRFIGHKSCESGDIKYLIHHMTPKNPVNKKNQSLS